MNLLQEEQKKFLDCKSEWYRIPERETQRWRVPPLPYGSWIKTNRIIVRTGYYISPMDMPIDLLEQRIIRHITNTINFYQNDPIRHKFVLTIPIDQKKQLILRDTDDLIDGNFTEDMVEIFLLSLDVYSYNYKKYLSKLIYRIRGKWAKEVKQEIIQSGKMTSWELNQRTFWYIDAEFHSQAREHVMRQCGQCFSPSGSYDHWSSEYNYDPGGLATTTYQKLLLIGGWNKSDWDYHNSKEYQIYVHPADINWSEHMGNPYGYIYDEWEEYIQQRRNGDIPVNRR